MSTDLKPAPTVVSVGPVFILRPEPQLKATPEFCAAARDNYRRFAKLGVLNHGLTPQQLRRACRSMARDVIEKPLRPSISGCHNADAVLREYENYRHNLTDDEIGHLDDWK